MQRHVSSTAFTGCIIFTLQSSPSSKLTSWLIEADLIFLSLSLCICLVFICMLQCTVIAMILSHANANAHSVCLVTFVVERHLKAMSGIFPPLFLSSLSISSFPHILSPTASSLDKNSPLPEGRSRSLRSNRSYSGGSVAVVKMTPLSFIPGAKIIKYLGIINMFFIRETTSLREVPV